MRSFLHTDPIVGILLPSGRQQSLHAAFQVSLNSQARRNDLSTDCQVRTKKYSLSSSPPGAFCESTTEEREPSTRNRSIPTPFKFRDKQATWDCTIFVFQSSESPQVRAMPLSGSLHRYSVLIGTDQSLTKRHAETSQCKNWINDPFAFHAKPQNSPTEQTPDSTLP